MIRFIALLAVLLLGGSIASFAQISDTSACYNRSELEKIAKRMVRANECDKLLLEADTAILQASTLISIKDKEIVDLKRLNTLCENDKEAYSKALKKQKLTNKLTKIIAGVIIITQSVAFSYFILKF